MLVDMHEAFAYMREALTTGDGAGGLAPATATTGTSGAYGNTTAVGADLAQGMAYALDNANTIQQQVMAAVSAELVAAARSLEKLSSEKIAAQKEYVKKINNVSGDSSEKSNEMSQATQNLNEVNSIYNQKEQTLTNTKDQFSNSLNTYETAAANLMQNSEAFARMFGAWNG